jgi:ABC-2 type transport system ATP-binding protein
MEQAEQICEHNCIIARGKKVLVGRLGELKRAAAAGGRVAIAFGDAAADRARADAVLADPALCASVRAAAAGDHADVELELAPGADAQRLLAALVGAEVALRRFEVVTPTLHQIFVDRVGRDAATVAARSEAGGAS